MRVFSFIFVTGLLLSGCRQSNTSDLLVTVYALDGPAMAGQGYSIGESGKWDPIKDYEPDQLFHGYPILGQVEINDPASAEMLAGTLEGRLASEQGLIAGCFVPRHGLRVVRGGVTTDYVICFECTNFEWYTNESEARIGQQSISSEHASAFTAPLLDAGVKLAAGAGER